MKPKLLWHSNAPWAPTGYGAQSGLVLPRLTDTYDVAVSAFYGLEGNKLAFNDIPVLPGWGNTFGNEALPAHAERFFDGKPGTIVTLMDVWVIEPNMIAALLAQGHTVACWTPVDHEPPPPQVKNFFARSGAVPIAMTKWGQEQLADFDPLYCPHVVDTSVYRPHPKPRARKDAGLPQNIFVAGMVAANKGWPARKCFPEVLEAWRTFHANHSDSILYLHTEPHGKYDGVNLPMLIESLGIGDSICFVDEYRNNYEPYVPELMAKVFAGIDVLLAPSMGEGFGIPVLEAGAVGTPAIVSDFAASPEILGAGWKVAGKKVWTKQNSWQFQPSVDDIIEALNEAYVSYKTGGKAMAKAAVEKAAEYEVNKVVSEQFLPALEGARQRFVEAKLEVVTA